MIADATQQLTEWVAKWQKILRLTDWNVTVRWGGLRDMDSPLDNMASGVLEYSLYKKTCIITIIEPGLYTSSVGIQQDVEMSIIHELLHIHFIAMPETENRALWELVEEQAISAIAKALVELDRRLSNAVS